MKILVFSDSHGNVSLLKKALEQNADAKAVLHAGDYARDISFLENSGLALYRVKGNCDCYDSFDEELVFTLDGVKILLAHGNAYGVKGSVSRFAKRTAECGAAIGIFGHTHASFRANVFGAFLLNPGSINPYNAARFPSYAVLETENSDIVKAEIINIV